MSQLNDLPHAVLRFYVTAPYPCSYLPGRMARSQVATPSHLIGADLYADLVRLGFRRSGIFTHRPYCDHCRACVPVRVPVAEFKTSRSQRRGGEARRAAASGDRPSLPGRALLALPPIPGEPPPLRERHGPDSRDQYSHFLLQSRVSTRLVEFRDQGKLMMVSIVDQLSDGLSSVYFLRPRSARRELRHLQHSVADRAVPARVAALFVSRLLDQGQPQDGVQGTLPADRRLHRRRVAAPLKPEEIEA
jgi:arginine-tRNA-protein transferase